MAEWGGYMGKILRVDLSSETIRDEELDEATARKYVGGTGLGIKYLYDEVPAEVGWSDERNRLIIAGGPLSGTRIGGSGTISVVFRGPLTNGAGAHQANGFFGAFLRFSGYDGMVIQGKAKRWVYLYIHDGTAELRDASHLLGKDTWETTDLIKSELGKSERGMSVISIGPAGENLVKWACPVVDKDHVPSHNGGGAVMGAKLLKAIAVDRGKARPPLLDKEGVDAVANALHDEIQWFPFGDGTLVVWLGGEMAKGGMCIINNWSKVYDDSEEIVEKLDKFGPIYVREKYQAERDPCWACNATHCHKLTITEGPYKGEPINEPEYEGSLAFGPVLGNYDVSTVFYLANLADRLGIDANEAGWTIGLAMECYEKGLVTKADTDSLELTWGNYKAIEQLMHRIARREGFGDVLAEGAMRAAQTIGGEAPNFAVYIKSGVTPRGVQFKESWPYFLDHCISNAGTNEGMEFMLRPSDVGIECSQDEGYRSVANDSPEQTVEFNVKCGWGGHFLDSLGVCFFSTNGDLGQLVAALRAATGWDLPNDEVHRIGRRIQALLRTFNIRCGHTAEMDAPSPRLAEPSNTPLHCEHIMPHFAELRSKYYEGMGWDKETSRPLPDTLRELGLEHAISELWGDA